MTLRAEIKERIAQTQARMHERGLGGLVVYFNGQHYMLRFNPLFYLSDFKPLGAAFAFVPATGEPILLVSPEADLPRALEARPFEQVFAAAPGRLAARAAELAQSLAQPLGLVGRGDMTAPFEREMRALLGASQDADGLLEPLAATRSDGELQRVERAAAIADEGFRCLCETVHVGMREHELAAEVEYAMQCAGSEDNYGLLGAGAHNLAVRAPSNRRIEAGDLVIGEITPCYRGYFAQLCRTLVVGAPTELQREKYDLLIRAEDAGFAAAAPGRPSSDIAKAVNKVIAEAGYGAYCRQPFMRTRGHGLGFGGVVPPDVTEDSGPVLEANMTMVIHPNQYIPETGYMMLGDTVVIEATGPRRLTQTPRQLFFKAA